MNDKLKNRLKSIAKEYEGKENPPEYVNTVRELLNLEKKC